MLTLFALGDTTIINLVFPRIPKTVIGGIAQLVIGAFERQLGARFQSHVRKEILEAISPSIADCNPSAAVIFVGRMIRVFASLFHVVPCGIFRSSMRVAVSFTALAQEFFLETAAGMSISSTEMLSADNSFISAITFAAPAFASEIGQDDEPSLSLA